MTLDITRDKSWTENQRTPYHLPLCFSWLLRSTTSSAACPYTTHPCRLSNLRRWKPSLTCLPSAAAVLVQSEKPERAIYNILNPPTLHYHGAYRTLTVVFHGFPGPFMCVFQDFPGPFMSIFHVFPGLFNRVDIKQVRFSYNTEYITQLIITLNNRSNRVWQWTMITYVKAKNVHGSEMWQPFDLYYMTFQAWKIWSLNSMTFQDLNVLSFFWLTNQLVHCQFTF